MVQPKPEDLSYEMMTQNRMQVIYGRKTQERQIFMEDLKDYRRRKDKLLIKEIKKSMGTKWYQALTVPQQRALDTLDLSIHQDLLEGRPTRTTVIMKVLGIIPRPRPEDLLNCVLHGRDDSKEMLAQLFFLMYQHSFDLRRDHYDINARLLLSSILYLGLPGLIKLLKEQFAPDQAEPPPKRKKKPKPEPPLASPYLAKMTAVMYEPKQWVHKLPAPLPNLEDLDEPMEETPPAPKIPPPPPPPPPPKKRIPVSYCDKLAGVTTIQPFSSVANLERNPQTILNPPGKKARKIAKIFPEEKKVYGIGNTRASLKKRRKKPKAPSTGLWNAQYKINGVAVVNGKVIFILGNVSMLPLEGEIIHGGHALVNGEHINIHMGVKGKLPPPAADHCDCVKKWQDSVFKYLKDTKCYCGHFYDYYNEGTFPPEELPFFEKPTRHGKMQFRLDNIYDIDEKRLHVAKDFKRIWDTDSVIHIDDDEDEIKRKPVKKKKKSSKTCLGEKPKIEDYLRCALRRFRRINIAAKLPDIYLVPELVVWMKKRLNGPYTREEKLYMKYKSNIYWTLFWRYAVHGIPHVPVPKVEEFNLPTTWRYKQRLNDKFRKFTNKYRLEAFRTHADFNNMMWPSMFQAPLPDKKFREIYYSYMYGTVEDLNLMRPYDSAETAFQYTQTLKKAYRCPPKGIENISA